MSKTRALFIAAGAAGLFMVTIAVAWASGTLSPGLETGKGTVSSPRSTPVAISSVGSRYSLGGVRGPLGSPARAGVLVNEQLGKAIFFDQNLSLNRNLACASCHGAAVGFTGPISEINQHGAVYEG